MDDAHITVALETRPAITEAQAEEMFDQAGDEPFHDDVAGVEFEGGALDPKRPALFHIELTEARDDKVRGMAAEAKHFLASEARAYRRDVQSVQVSDVRAPYFVVVGATLPHDAQCSDHPEASHRVRETEMFGRVVCNKCDEVVGAL